MQRRACAGASLELAAEPHWLYIRQIDCNWSPCSKPVTLSRTPSKMAACPPEFGEQTDEVLKEFGFDADEIAKLRDAKVV
jgi:crotonobetainyl-CoA:carnitine CoA-transferase CaiB-like acyl-CoA transferase